MNFRYQRARGEESYVTQLGKHGKLRAVDTAFFGLAFQVGEEPLIISELGQYDPGGRNGFSGNSNQGVYSLMLIRLSDKNVVASVTLDMSRAPADALGFKYAKLATPFALRRAPTNQ